MSWDQIISHADVQKRFRDSARRNRLASTYLFVGPEGVGKRTFALKLAQAMLCEANPHADLEPCQTCSGCLQVAKQTHPDLLLINKPPDKSILPVELFIGRKERRHREGLVYEIGLKPFRGGYRIAIIDDADFFNKESANSLLKTLEEPPPHSMLILLGTGEQRQLRTIVSRSQVIRFHPLSEDQIVTLIQRNQLLDPDSTSTELNLEALARAAEGSVARAIQLAEPEVYEFRAQLRKQLASGDPHADQFTKGVIAFADAAGKESLRKRPRLTLAGDLTISFFRESLIALAGFSDGTPGDDPFVPTFVGRFQSDPLLGADLIGQAIERTEQMQAHVKANAGLPNLVDSWLIDLGRVLRGDVVTTGDILTGYV